MIRFPQMHIASSVVNRILNVADGLPEPVTGAQASVPEVGATVGQQSAALDQRLQATPGEVPPIEAAPDPGAIVTGRPVLDTLIDPD